MKLRAILPSIVAISLAGACGAMQPPTIPGAAAAQATPAVAASSPAKLLDQAAQTLAALHTDLADDSVLLGIPTPQQKKRAERAASDAMTILQQAQSSLAAAIRRAEDRLIGKPGETIAPETAAQVEAELTQLVDVEQTQRLPLLRGLAQALLAGAAEGPARADAAAAAIVHLRSVQPSSGKADAARRIGLAAALLRSTPMTNESVKEAEGLIRALSAGQDFDADTARRARMVATLVHPNEPAQDETHDLLLAEARARGLVEGTRRDPPERSRAVRTACELLLACVNASPPLTTAESQEARRLLIYAKVAAIIDPAVPMGDLPPEAAFARAITAARETPASAEADTILAQLEDRADVPNHLLRTAAWERLVVLGARAAAASNDRAAQETELAALIRYVERFPDDPRAMMAAERAEARFNVVARRDGAAGSFIAAHGASIDKIADLLLDKAPTPDRARAALPRRLQALSASPSAAGVAQVSSVLQTAKFPSDSAETAQVRAALVQVVRGMQSQVVEGAQTAQRCVELCRAVQEAFRQLGGAPGPEADRVIADALALSDRRADLDEAAAMYRAALAAIGPGDNWASFGLAGIQRKAGDTVGAIQTLRAFADSRQPPGAGEPYWRAWAEILEMYSTQNANGVRDAEIRAQIKRLELLDPNFGTAATAVRIRAVRERLK